MCSSTAPSNEYRVTSQASTITHELRHLKTKTMPPPSGISIGLGTAKPKKPSGPLKPKKPLLSAFAADCDAHSGEENSGVFGASKAKNDQKNPRQIKRQRRLHSQRATGASTSSPRRPNKQPRRWTRRSTIWEDMKAWTGARKKLRTHDIERKDQLRAKEKMLQKGRGGQGKDFTIRRGLSPKRIKSSKGSRRSWRRRGLGKVLSGRRGWMAGVGC